MRPKSSIESSLPAPLKCIGKTCRPPSICRLLSGVDIAIAVETLGREEAAALILGAGLDAGVHLWRAPPPVAPIEARCRRAESAARAWRRAFLALGFVIALAWGLR